MAGMISDRVLEALEWDRIVELLAAGCESGPGRAFARALEPLPLHAAASRLRKITELKNISAIENDAPDFSGVEDVGTLSALAAKGAALSLAELASVRDFLAASRRVRGFLKSHRANYPEIGSEADGISPMEELTSLLSRSITESGQLSRSVYPRLAALEDEALSLRGEIERQLTSMMHSPSVAHCLQEKMFTTLGDRYVLLVKASSRGRIRGTVHDVSASEATLYLEPDAVTDLNNRMVMKERELRTEILKILVALSAQVGLGSGELAANQAALAGLDFINAASRFSKAIRGSAPELTEECAADLLDARHPLLHLMNPEGVVPNTVKLGEGRRCLLISGANTGGKTVLLKTIGLCALLAKHGLHIPAGPDSRIAVFDGIFADIGDDQNLSQSLSTFSGQIVALRDMLERADSRSLVLVDEIVVGTNPRQGAALARAILESMVETGALIVATTHYSELKNLASADARFLNASVSFDPETFAPTYRLMTGIPGSSHAIEIAGLYGLAPDVTSRARSLLDETELSSEALIEKVQRLDEELHRERAFIEGLKAELEREKRGLEEGRRRLRSLEAELKTARGLEFIDELNEMKRAISERAREIRGADMRRLGEIRGEIEKAEHAARRKVESADTDRRARTHVPFDPAKAGPGDEVLVLPLGKRGVIESVDLGQGTVQVLLGGALRSRHPFGELMLPREAKKKRKAEPAAKPTPDPEPENTVPLTVQTSYNTIDLRGKRVDEATQIMNSMLDSMTRSGMRSAVIIHGHGTGALKEAVRGALRFSSYVMEFRPGDYGEGGDGVTIALLRA
jgi:DNA mismatch repair protein MutS2